MRDELIGTPHTTDALEDGFLRNVACGVVRDESVRFLFVLKSIGTCHEPSMAADHRTWVCLLNMTMLSSFSFIS